MMSDVGQVYYERSTEGLIDRDIQAEHAPRLLNHGSVSFGRFVGETLAWEKWSVFSQNRYKEELQQLQRCSAPGSVAKKKAYFEEYYKKLAAQKALKEQEEQAQKALKEDEKAPQVMKEAGAQAHEQKTLNDLRDQKQHEEMLNKLVQKTCKTPHEKTEQSLEDKKSMLSLDQNGYDHILVASEDNSSVNAQINMSGENSQHLDQITIEATASRGCSCESTITHFDRGDLQASNQKQYQEMLNKQKQNACTTPLEITKQQFEDQESMVSLHQNGQTHIQDIPSHHSSSVNAQMSVSQEDSQHLDKMTTGGGLQVPDCVRHNTGGEHHLTMRGMDLKESSSVEVAGKETIDAVVKKDTHPYCNESKDGMASVESSQKSNDTHSYCNESKDGMASVESSQKSNDYPGDCQSQAFKENSVGSSLLTEGNDQDLCKPTEELRILSAKNTKGSAKHEGIPSYKASGCLTNQTRQKATSAAKSNTAGTTTKKVGSTKSNGLATWLKPSMITFAQQRASPLKNNKLGSSLRMSRVASSTQREQLAQPVRSSSLLRLATTGSSIQQKSAVKGNKSISLLRMSTNASRSDNAFSKSNRSGSTLKGSFTSTPEHASNNKQQSEASLLDTISPTPFTSMDNGVLPARTSSQEDKNVATKSLKGLTHPLKSTPLKARSTVPKPFTLTTEKRAAISDNMEKSISDEVSKGQTKDHGFIRKETSLKETTGRSAAKASAAEKKRSPKDIARTPRTPVQKLIKHSEGNSQGTSTSADILNVPNSSVRKSSLTTGTPFGLRSSERAEKRKEKEGDLKELRKTLAFKATPLPRFYHETNRPKIEIKKVPPTRAKSPMLGRRCSDRDKAMSKSMPTLNLQQADKIKNATPTVKHFETPSKTKTPSTSERLQKGSTPARTRAIKRKEEPMIASSSKQLRNNLSSNTCAMKHTEPILSPTSRETKLKSKHSGSNRSSVPNISKTDPSYLSSNGGQAALIDGHSHTLKLGMDGTGTGSPKANRELLEISKGLEDAATEQQYADL
eukprot:TRINITY_DN543_c0_g1_i8.p1 TRINITY_DN543_c0_g1~~TRINITY_DN543_c0_g1_i8.p1  ORF type:complete len:1022 (-),score=216.94 TRINITY_DN543_c0_g1_i8:813-3878(-)